MNNYFRLALKNNYPAYKEWYITMLSILQDGYEDNYVKITGNKATLKLPDTTIEVPYPNKSLINLSDKVKVSDILPNMVDDKPRAIGKIINNYLLLAIPFKSKIEFMDDISISNVTKVIAARLLTGKPNEITRQEYDKFTYVLEMIKEISYLVATTANEANMTVDKNFKQDKAKLIAEYDKKYGKAWREDPVISAQWETALKAIDYEYLKANDKDLDKTKFISGKILNNSRKNTKIAIGNKKVDSTGKRITITKSLNEGYDLYKDDDTMLALINANTEASISSGKDTALGGVIYKVMSRAMADARVEDTDCKTTKYEEVTLTEDNKEMYINRYTINNKLITADDIDSYIGKPLKIRTPRRCKLKGKTYCRYCAGEYLFQNNSSLGALASGLAGTIVNIYLKARHQMITETTRVDIRDYMV